MQTSVSKTAVSTPEAPAAIGPYSQAIRVGDTLFTSGQIPIDPATGNFVPGGITEQTVRVCENLKAVLAAAGLNVSHVVKTTVFLKDMKDFAAMNEVYGRYFGPEGAVPPARSTVQVAALPKDALVEIECIARGDAEVESANQRFGNGEHHEQRDPAAVQYVAGCCGNVAGCERAAAQGSS